MSQMFKPRRRASSSTLGLLCCFALWSVAGIGCSKGVQLEMPSDVGSVPAFPGDAAPAAAQATPGSQGEVKPLQIVRAEPDKGAQWTGVVSVVFSEDMQPGSFGVSSKEGPFKIEPAVEGSFSWWGMRTVVFRPDKPLPPGTRYKVTVDPEAKALNGAKLQKAHSFSFMTRGLTRPSIYADTYGQLKPESTFNVTFNLPVALDVVQAHVKLLAGGQVVPVQITPAMEGPQDKQVASERRFIVKPLSPLKFKTSYRLFVDAKVTPKGGAQPLGASTERAFHTPGDLLVAQIGCGYQDKCNPYDSLRINFSNAVEFKDVQSCIKLSPSVPLELQYSYGTNVSVRPKVWEPGKTYKVTVSGRCVDIYKHPLANSLEKSFTVADHYPSLSMETGLVNLEPGTKKLFPIRARNYAQGQLRMTAISPDKLGEFLARLPKSWGGQDPFVGASFAPKIERAQALGAKRNTFQTTFLDLDEALQKRPVGLVYLDMDVSAPGQSTARSRRQVGHWSLVSVSDMGITTKLGPESSLVWVTSLGGAKPQGGVDVVFYDAKGQESWRGQTDAEGLVKAPGVNLNGGDPKARPAYIAAIRKEEIALLPVDSYDYTLQPYRFGMPTSWDESDVSVVSSMFTERGVYRPGEDVYVKGLVREQTGEGLSNVDAQVMSISVQDPRGKIIQTREARLSELGGFDFKLMLKDNAPLGSYSIKARPKSDKYDDSQSAVAQGYFRVEAYRAPRFEVKISPPAESMTLGQSDKVELSGRYLFGASMQKANYSVYVDMEQGSFSAKSFPTFSFSAEPEYWYWWDYEGNYEGRGRVGVTSATGQLDDQGVASIPVDLSKLTKRSGPQRLLVEAEVNDVDGQRISASKSVTVHPADFYVGVKSPGYLIEANKNFSVPMVAVDHAGQPVTGKSISAKLMRRQWVSVKKKVAGGGESWTSELQVKEVGACQKTSERAPVSCDFKVEKGGSYTVEVTSKDAQGRETSAKEYFYAWQGDGESWWPRRDDAVIQLIADKDSYKPGETARLMVQSPFKEARALVTVEREGVISRKLVELKGQTPTVEVPVTDEMMPNAFVSVTLVRGRIPVDPKVKTQGPAEVDPGKPAFKMGYAKLTVDNSSKALAVSVKPSKARYSPGDEAQVEVELKDAQGQGVGGEVTLMVVDEGVLSLTGYQTPQPFKTFYRERALGVSSLESRMRLLAKLDAKGNKGEPGGDGEEGGANYRSKFATTAAFVPAVKVGADGKGVASFKLPEGLTAYRVMAVAVADQQRFGSSEERITVSLPLLVRAATPRFVATGDVMKLRAVVQSTGQFNGPVEVIASVDGSVKLTGESSQKITLKPGQAMTVGFDAQALDPGEATVRFAIKAEGFEDGEEIKLPVKYPAAQQHVLLSGTLTEESPNLWRKLVLPEHVYQGSGELEVELSSTAYGELVPGLEYLIGYPYGCIEQTTGRTLPLVAMQDSLKGYDLPGLPSAKVPEFVQSGVDRLLSMQTANGGLGYWPGDVQAHPWGSAYGGLAVVLAKKRGYKVDEAAYKRLLNYLDGVMRGKQRETSYWGAKPLLATSTLAAYTLAEAGKADEAYHEFLFNQRASLPKWGKGLLLMAINRAKKGGALTDRREQMLSKLRNEMLEGVDLQSGVANLGEQDDDEFWMTMTSDVRTNAIGLMAMLETAPQDELVGQLAKGLLDARQGGHWFSTQSNAFALLALSRYFDTVERGEPAYDVAVGVGERVLASEPFRGKSLVGERVVIPMKELAKHQGKLLTLMRRGDGGPLYYTLKLRYYDREPVTKQVHSGFSYMREYLYADGPNRDKPVTGPFKVGDIIKVKLTIVAPEERRYVAVEDPIPAGFEPINTSFSTVGRRTAELLNDPDHDDWWDYWWYEPSFDHIEQRDDRVVMFANTMSPRVYNHAYLLRASTPGTFSAPAGRVEEMYHPNVFGTTKAIQVTIR